MQEPFDVPVHYEMFTIETEKCIKLYDKTPATNESLLFKSINWKDQKRRIIFKVIN